MAPAIGHAAIYLAAERLVRAQSCYSGPIVSDLLIFAAEDVGTEHFEVQTPLFRGTHGAEI